MQAGVGHRSNKYSVERPDVTVASLKLVQFWLHFVELALAFPLVRLQQLTVSHLDVVYVCVCNALTELYLLLDLFYSYINHILQSGVTSLVTCLNIAAHLHHFGW